MSAATQSTLAQFPVTVEFDRENRLELLRKARKRARKRYFAAADNRRCDSCGVDAPLEVHHVDGNPLNNHLVNLAGTCHRCHKAVHKAENTHAHVQQWKAEFAEAMA